MKLIVNEKDDCCEFINIHCTPAEALVINHVMRRYIDDEEVNEADRAIIKHMLGVKPIFRKIEEESEDKQ